MARKFNAVHAVRGRTPLVLGLVGPSGTGKTKSGLRLADGMARLDKKRKTFVIDTEGGRSRHFAKEHEFEWVDFPPPHSPVDYLTALDYAIAQGAGRILIDSMSHEHDGAGGVLETHKQEMGGDFKKQLQAWALPKQQRRALINRMVSSGVDLILCFRAARKIKPVSKAQPVDLGWMPVGGNEFMFEMTLKLLLLPGARGVPTFRSEFTGEREMIKLPGQFEALFARPLQLSEDIGEQLARWANGGDAVVTADKPSSLPEMLTRLGACSDRETLDMLAGECRVLNPTLAPADQKRLATTFRGADAHVKLLEAQAAMAAKEFAASVILDNQEAGSTAGAPGFEITTEQTATTSAEGGAAA